MLEGFPPISASASEGRFTVTSEGHTVTVFTARSAERDLAVIRGLLEKSTTGSIPVIVSPYRAELAPLFSGQEKFVLIAPVHFAADLPADSRLVANNDQVEFFVNSIGQNDKYEIHVAPQWQSLADGMRIAAQRLFERAAVRLRTIRHFGRLWQINFRLNAAGNPADVSRLGLFRPDVLVMAGPSLDAALADVARASLVWCADTALPVLAAHGIYPRVVFSVDAGFASQEHFCGLAGQIRQRQMLLVCDLLGNAAVQRLPFAEKLFYQSSHPLVQQYCSMTGHHLTPVENPRGDVGSLMRNVYALLFGARAVPVAGHDGRSIRKITHARGTAYFSRTFGMQNRLFTPELYLAQLSRRYG